MATKDIVWMSIILLVIIITSVISWKEKNNARNFVLNSKTALEDLLNQAEDLLDKNPEVAPPFFDDFHEMWCDLINLFQGVDENTFDICWVTKQKEVLIFKHSITAKVVEIKEDIQIVIDAKFHVPLLLELLPPLLSEVRKKISEGKLSEDKAKPYLDRAHGWFSEACAVMRQSQDHSLIWGMLRSANEELGLADSFEV